MSASNRKLNITCGVLNIIYSIASIPIMLVLSIIFGLAYGFAKNQVMSDLTSVLISIYIVGAILLFFSSILLFIRQIKFKAVVSILDVLVLIVSAVLTVIVYTGKNVNAETGVATPVTTDYALLIVILAVIAGLVLLHFLNMFLKGKEESELNGVHDQITNMPVSVEVNNANDGGFDVNNTAGEENKWTKNISNMLIFFLFFFMFNFFTSWFFRALF